MNTQAGLNGPEPKLDEETLGYLIGLRDYGYEHVLLPKIGPLRDFIAAIETVINGLMDPSIGPYVGDALQETDETKDIGSRVSDLVGELESVRHAVADSGAATRRGRPRSPASDESVARKLISFYRSRTGDISGPYFVLDDAHKPGNAFTKWFCATLPLILPAVSASTCQTLARQFGQKTGR
ncbi:hypothetical protein [Mesorhizobium sp. IMUNJ 23232]|uniref:hypothetical protein n=1 Tax=Mesorhizobium sp. IMUNJ 23232 TaxID=3376064 RepID=UPI0037A288DE